MQSMDDRPPACFETSSLGRGQVGRQREASKVLQRLVETFEFRFERARSGRERHGRRRIGAEHAERIAEQFATIRVVCRSPDVHQRERVAQSQAMMLDRTQHPILLRVRERAEPVRERRAERAPTQGRFDAR